MIVTQDHVGGVDVGRQSVLLSARKAGATSMMTEHLIVVGISHRTAPVDVLGRCVLGGCDGSGVASDVTGGDELVELLPLSTCNRKEFYAVGPDPEAARAMLAGAIASMSGMSAADLSRSLYVHRGRQAVRHLFRVTSSLDSMVLGESEIQGQVRRAWDAASAVGATGPVLDRLFRRALQVGRRVRCETRIGEGRVSVPSIAVGMVERAVGVLDDKRVVIIGAGQIAGVAAEALAARKVRDVLVVSRSLEHATSLAGPRGWRSDALTALGDEIGNADVIIGATSAPHVLVSGRDIEHAMRRRPGRPMAIIDMAVPADVDSAAGAVAGVELHTMEDIRAVAAASSDERLAQAALAEDLIFREVARFATERPSRHVATAVAVA